MIPKMTGATHLQCNPHLQLIN